MPASRQADRIMRSATFILALAVLMFFTPASILTSAGVPEGYEVEMLRMTGIVLFGQAALVARIARKRIIDSRWRRIVLAGDFAVFLGVAYFITWNPFFLFVGFSVVAAIMVRTLMPVLDQWSHEVRLQAERRYGKR